MLKFCRVSALKLCIEPREALLQGIFRAGVDHLLPYCNFIATPRSIQADSLLSIGHVLARNETKMQPKSLGVLSRSVIGERTASLSQVTSQLTVKSRFNRAEKALGDAST